MTKLGSVMRVCAAIAALGCVSAAAAEEPGYKPAPGELDRLISAPLTPHILPAPGKGRAAIVAQPYGVRTIGELAEPELRLAGFRFNPDTWARGREPWTVTYYRSLSLIDLSDGRTRAISGLPTTGRITSVAWSPDGARAAVSVAGYDDGRRHGLWLVDAATASATRIDGIDVNSVLGAPCTWLSNNAMLACLAVPASRGAAPVASADTIAPAIEANDGKAAPGRTYQDLLKTPLDEKLLDHHMATELALVGTDGTVRRIGRAALHDRVAPSPDGQWLLVSERVHPYSYQFPLDKFPQRLSVFRLADGSVTKVIEKPLESEVPIAMDAVGPGPRAVEWRPDAPATLVWANALDGGDPARAVAERDELLTLSAPFTAAPASLARLQARFHELSWSADGNALIEERWRKTRLRRLSTLDSAGPRKLYEGSSEDGYADPGAPLMTVNTQGAPVMADAGKGKVWLTGTGGTPQGDRPFASRLDLATGARSIAWRSAADRYEEAQAPLADGRLLVRRESATVPPDYYLIAPGGRATRLTHFPNPFGTTALAQKKLLHYSRADGVPLTATLYLPPDYKPADGPLPTVLHAYPAEFKSRETAGQVKGSPNRFPVYGFYQLYPLLAYRGYAVLFNTALPVIGEGASEPNDSFVEQLVSGAKAAIDEGVRLGVVDRARVGVTGHSYGAFMTANLLAHSDLFKAGVALSGAYNRTLTPFGFQNEARTYWQAPALYARMSPFSCADRIRQPLSLIHGAADDNMGTFPIQTERFYAALKGHGATTRLTMLPFEAHRYDARESLGQVVWDWDDWFGRYLKDAK
jgi:dipeptidyl aminopeptidase/acylaminoacyl peptidase